MRLQAYLADCGVASRRKAAQIISGGLVSVNGAAVFEPGTEIREGKDEIRLQGRRIFPEKKLYFVLNKPKNVVTTLSDERGRRSVADYFGRVGERLFPVGRLDRNSTGLVLMTNDGEWAHRLMHPAGGIRKYYEVWVDPPLSSQQRLCFARGVWLDGARTAPARIHEIGRKGGAAAYEVVLGEGKNRQIRRMMAVLGAFVRALHRYRYGSLTLKGVPSGTFRALTGREVEALSREALPGGAGPRKTAAAAAKPHGRPQDHA
jgi:23S rRNA pseudouridine2605 synthase